MKYQHFLETVYAYRSGDYPTKANTLWQFIKNAFHELFGYFPGAAYTEDDLYLIISYHLLAKEGTTRYKKSNYHAAQVMLKDLERGRRMLSETHRTFLKYQVVKEQKTMETKLNQKRSYTKRPGVRYGRPAKTTAKPVAKVAKTPAKTPKTAA